MTVRARPGLQLGPGLLVAEHGADDPVSLRRKPTAAIRFATAAPDAAAVLTTSTT